MLKIRNLELNLSENKFFLYNNLENKLFASIQMIVPKIKIAITKIF